VFARTAPPETGAVSAQPAMDQRPEKQWQVQPSSHASVWSNLDTNVLSGRFTEPGSHVR